MTKINAFAWYGGKYGHLNWLLPLLPPTTHFCDVFGGSAVVLLNRSPSPVETYNDIDGELVNFFQVLRDQQDQLIAQIQLTPFARAEMILACVRDPNLPALERARRFFIRARQVRNGLGQRATPGRWAYCIVSSRQGMSGSVSRWFSSPEYLAVVANRLRTVQIEQQTATQLIERYDHEQTLFYCDPPYLHSSRGDPHAYAFEMDDQAHRNLSELLHRIKGKVAISGYRSGLYDQLYLDFRRVDNLPKTIHSSKGIRQESLWCNY